MKKWFWIILVWIGETIAVYPGFNNIDGVVWKAVTLISALLIGLSFSFKLYKTGL